MENFDADDMGLKDPDTHKKLRRCQIINVVLVVVVVLLILVLCIVPPLVCEDNDDKGCSPVSVNPISPQRVVQPCNVSDEFEDVEDVIIVGGGPAGTFVGYRLLTASSLLPKVLLLEATDRIGGRLYSENLPGIDFNVAELGGMRYINSTQPYITKIIEDLGIDHKRFLMAEENDERPYMFRDLFVQQKNLREAGKAYQLKPEEQNKTPDELSELVFENFVPLGERDKSPNTMLSFQEYPLLHYGSINTYNLGNASDDAHNYVIAGSGYSDGYSNDNAAGSIGDSNATSRSGGYRAPVDGMQKVPLTLAESFKKMSGRIHLNTTVTRIDECQLPGNSKRYLLTTYNYATLDTKVYYAKKVVLAITRTQLKRIHWDALWTSEKRDLVDSVISRDAAKIFLAFREPWWRKESLQYLNLTHGRTVSSLPNRQTFYFTAPDPQASNNSFIMLYNDGQFTKFWRALATSAFKQFPTSPSAIYPMTDVFVAEAVRQLAINHNTTEDVIGNPYFAWMMAWDPDQLPRLVEGYGPFMPSEAWTLWAPGYNYTEVTEDVMQLDETQDIFLCGSVYSVQQGWAEGAFEHADQMLHNHFNLSYYLTPPEMTTLREAFYAQRRIPLYP